MAISQFENGQKKIDETLNWQVLLTPEIIESFENTINLVKCNQQVIKSGLILRFVRNWGLLFWF